VFKKGSRSRLPFLNGEFELSAEDISDLERLLGSKNV